MKSRCVSIQRYFSDYIDCTLSGRQIVTVAHHLRSCPACRRELESLKRTKTLLQDFYVEPDAPDGYHDLFWQQLQRTVEQTSPRPIWWHATVLWEAFAWRAQDLLDRLAYFCGSLINTPIQWAGNQVKLSPLYTLIFGLTLTIFFAYQFFPIEDDPDQFGSS